MLVVGYILAVIGAIGGIWILIDAFQTSVAQGFLTLCVPCYVFYFLFAVSENPRKFLQLGLLIAGAVGNGIIGSQQAQLHQ